MKVGFAGLGLMGSPMAMHLVRAGLDVAVYNRTASRTEPHRKAGTQVCNSLGELGSLCEIVLICVSDTPDVEQVIFAPGALADTMSAGSLIVDHSTISPTASRAFAATDASRSTPITYAPRSAAAMQTPADGPVPISSSRDDGVRLRASSMAAICSGVLAP